MWIFKGKEYKTVAGLTKVLAKDCGAVSVGMVGKNRTICAYNRLDNVCARYKVGAPDPDGVKPMNVTREL